MLPRKGRRKKIGNNSRNGQEKQQVRNVENPNSNPNGLGINVTAKEGVPNPSNTRVRIEENMEAGKENPGGNRSPNPSGNRIKDTATKQRTVDWVQRSFGTHKEALSVTLNHLCQEVPSQTFVESPKLTGATRGSRQLWSDEVQEFDDDFEANISTKTDDQMCNLQLEQANIVDIRSTVNPSS